MKREKWVDVAGSGGKYMVSDLGRFRSYTKKMKGGFMKPYKTELGYTRIPLAINGKVKLHYIQRLVWASFNGPVPENLEVDHINRIRDDNRLCNLRLLSPLENRGKHG